MHTYNIEHGETESSDLRVAAVRSRSRENATEEDDDTRTRKQRAAERPHRGVHRGHSFPTEDGAARSPLTRSVKQNDTSGEAGQGEHEVTHDELRLQIENHREPAEDGIAEEPDAHKNAEAHEIDAVGASNQSRKYTYGCGQQAESRDHAISELNRRVLARFRHDVSGLAGWPVRTAEPGTGEAYGGTGQHDEAEKNGREQRDDPERAN